MFSGRVLKKRREELGFSQAEMARRLAVSRPAYFKWEKGQTIPNRGHIQRLSELLEVEVAYFESEHEIVKTFLLLNRQNQEKAQDFVDKLLREEREKKVVPLFPIQVLSDIPLSAGVGSSYYDSYSWETVYASQEYSYDFANFVDGDSMEPYYQSGEVVLVRESSFDYDGAVYAIYLNGRTYIKRVYKESNRYRMVSYNDAYDDFYASEEDDFRIVGKIIGNFMPIEEGD